MYRQKLVIWGFAAASTERRLPRSQPAAARTNTLVLAVMLLILLWVGLALLNVAAAGDVSWHQTSDRYDVYLGVVPVTLVRSRAAFVAGHPGVDRQGSSSQHIMVAVLRRPGGERVTDATVSAEVVESKFLREFDQKKSLKKGAFNGMVTFCNFFDLHWNGTYKIRVEIKEPGTPGENVVTFYQKFEG